jgi:ligand-binding SRPBCC domain-containing protein
MEKVEMPVIEHKEFIRAPIEICFDLARDVGVPTQTTWKTRVKAVAGLTGGLLQEGDTVTWEAVHFGFKQRHTARVIFMEKPNSFVEVMVKGAFRSFIHIHQFIEEEDGTTMLDHFQYNSRFGPIGVLIDKLFLEKYMAKLIVFRAMELRGIAEKRI